MTLTQYINQKEPIHFPNVILEENEYTVVSSLKIAGEIHKRVYINTKSLAAIEYCLIGTKLYTTDKDGNPKNISCFRIKNTNQN